MCGGFPRRKNVIEFTILDFPVCDSFSHSLNTEHHSYLSREQTVHVSDDDVVSVSWTLPCSPK